MKYFSDVDWLWKNESKNEYNTRYIIRLNTWEASLLWKYVKISSGDVIEIGRKYGGSTILISEALSHTKRKVLSIDPVNAIKDVCQTYIKENSLRIELIEMTSQEAHKRIKFNNTDCIFIDGDHSYDGVKSDTELFWDYLNLNGYVIYHDCDIPSQGKVEIFCENWSSQGYMKLVEQKQSMAVFQKIK